MTASDTTPPVDRAALARLAALLDAMPGLFGGINTPTGLHPDFTEGVAAYLLAAGVTLRPASAAVAPPALDVAWAEAEELTALAARLRSALEPEGRGEGEGR